MTDAIEKPATSHMKLWVVLASAALVLVLAEWASSRIVSDVTADEESKLKRPDDVLIVLKNPALLPPPKPEPSVWMLGNSHTYALPGMKQGDKLRTDEYGILIDEMSARVGRQYADKHANFYLLAYPNFLPFEMLTRVGHLLYHDHRPTVVFIGLTWRNIARDSRLRHEVYTAYHDKAFADDLVRMLSDAKVHADPAVIEEIRAQQTRVEHDEQLERLRSDSDKLDESLANMTVNRLTLMGKSAELRAQIFRTLTDRVQRLWDDRKNVTYSYDMLEHDFVFNVECIRAMVRLLREHGATVVCYYAPERSDLPPLMDPKPQQKFIEDFNREADELGIIVLDARPLVPNEFWGWVDNSPDRSHFTEPGHQILTQFLLEEAAKRGVWKALEKDVR